MKLENVKVHKMGNKLGIYFSKFYFPKGSLVQIIITKEDKQKEFLTKFNNVITLRREIENTLNLNYQDLITLEIQEIKNVERTKELFYDDKIDMLSLTPEKTSKGYEIVVTEFDKNNENWLRIWYSHERGSGQQLEIRRFTDIATLGSLLGQYQAEGTKNKNTDKFRVEFANKLIPEHQEFIDSLSKLGIPKDACEFRFTYNPNRLSEEETINHVKNFETIIGCKAKISQGNSKGIGFRTIIRNTILTEIVLNSLDKIRNLLANESKYTHNQQELANNFLAKLLTGDGTLDVRCNRRDFPELHMKIVDQDLNYLKDYCAILRNNGFKTRINERRICVISSCSFRGLLYLYRIKAFKNSGSWNKLITAIALCLRGRRYYTYSRFSELADYKKFGTSVISKGFQMQSNMASDWLNNKTKENLIAKNGYNSWSLTLEGKILVETLKSWSEDYKNLKNLKGFENPFHLLETLKVKKYKKIKCLSEECS
ncbi:hypothetical protein HY637_02610 [Candidatus Woesearchaeota archaeon]|nr:hypothetical protein [Candidatus Woesearchaeota archaeon]